MRVKTADEFRLLFTDWPCLPLNVVYADINGKMGYQMAGNAPRRKRGHGSLPMPGWDQSYAWEGLMPFDEMPHVEQPANGVFATANNAPPGHEQQSPLGIDWMEPYRLNAIYEALAKRVLWSVTECQKLQLDLHSAAWLEVRDVLLAAIRGDDRVR